MKNIKRTLTLVLLAAALSSPALAGEPKSGPTPAYTKAVSLFNEYIAANRKAGIWKGQEANLPFIQEHGRRSGRSILLIHGLTDSPAYMRDLGKIFFDRGYNVVGVRLRGHGTKPEDLHTVTRDDWQNDVDAGVAAARALGAEVSLAGFSTGGAMALDVVQRRHKLAQKEQWNLGDVFLFSPAVDLPWATRNAVALLCGREGVGLASKLKPWASGGADTVEDNPFGYNKMSANGVCQLNHQIARNRTNRAAINAGLVGKGVYIVQSKADATVDVLKTVDFQTKLPDGLDWNLTLYDEKDQIQHANVPRASTNPKFAAMKGDIENFIERCDARNGLRALDPRELYKN